VFAKDPISRVGVSGQLQAIGDIDILEPGDDRPAAVAVVVVDKVSDEVLRLIRTIRRGMSKIVLVASVLDDAAVAAATEAGVVGLLCRSDADYRQLAGAVRKAHWCESTAMSPAAHRGRRLTSLSRPEFGNEWQTTTQGLSARDRDVLRFLAEGCDTAEIARHLAYSEPTIKNVIQRLFEQLQARNRPHAVAIALRAGII